MLDLLDQAVQRLGIGNRAVIDPLLIALPALPDRLQIGLGLLLGQLQVRDPGLGLDQRLGRRIALLLQPRQLGMLGQVGPPVPQLGDRRVDGLQVQQP